MKLQDLVELDKSMEIQTNTKILKVKPTKGNRIYIGFLELIFGVRYNLKDKKLDLTKINEDISIEYNDNFGTDRVELIHDIKKVSKILEAGILNKLEKYFLVRKSVTEVDDGDYDNISIQDVMLILTHYHLGIKAVLSSSETSSVEKDNIIDLREQFFDICRKYFDMSGSSLKRFGQKDIVEFVQHVSGNFK